MANSSADQIDTRLTARQKIWRPKPRPDWVQKIIQEGSYMDIANLVPLDEESLIETAKRNTGLRDFGDDNWREPFGILVRDLEEHARLHLMGRIMTRADLLIHLEARLQIQEAYKQYPEIDDEEVDGLFYIIGQGRSGTSLLQNIMSADPANGTTMGWEIMYPCPPPTQENYHSDERIAKADHIIGTLNRVVPELASMHEFGAKIPTECIQLHCLTFISPWLLSFGGQAPNYAAYLQTADMEAVYRYEKRVLKLLQWKNPRQRWVMKSPACIMHIPEILKVYPDVKFIWPHRDPVKALASVVNLLGTLYWSRSDHPFIGDSMAMFTNPEISAFNLCRPIELLESGVLPESQLYNLQYLDLVADPVQAVLNIYHYFDVTAEAESGQALREYMQANPRNKHSAHSYVLGDSENIAMERQAYQKYQQYFSVQNEI
ncbi:MAG: sulfotransferase [Halieaceae bacterium]|nr:sulfotransferase [Halieaceae bacterium]